jgi:hypothetical protein
MRALRLQDFRVHCLLLGTTNQLQPFPLWIQATSRLADWRHILAGNWAQGIACGVHFPGVAASRSTVISAQ